MQSILSAVGASRISVCRISSSSSSSSSFPTQFVRFHSSLPVLNDYVRRTYPFPTILESNIPPDYSKWLYYHQQHPTSLPTYKSKLIVDIRDLGLDPTSRMALREMVGDRYNPKTHQISFVSRNLPTAQANENRVFQQLDECLVEARTIAKKINQDGFFAKESGAKHNRLLKPVPEQQEVLSALFEQRRNTLNKTNTQADTKKTPKLSEKQKNEAALGESTTTQ